MSWSVLAVCTIRARIGMKGSTSICSSWIRRPRRWAGSVARAQHDFFRFALVPETSSDDRLLTELTSVTHEPLRGDMLKRARWKLNGSVVKFISLPEFMGNYCVWRMLHILYARHLVKHDSKLNKIKKKGNPLFIRRCKWKMQVKNTYCGWKLCIT